VLAGVLVAAVLAMHGPAAGYGCPGGDSMPAEPMHAGAHSTVLAATHPVPAMAMPMVMATAGHQGHGQTCQSTPPRSGAAGLLALLIAALRTVAVAGPAVRRFDGRRRAPPPYGADLLRRLCISRT
jgi:hypothetical protein